MNKFSTWHESGSHKVGLVALGTALRSAQREAEKANCVRRQVGATLINQGGCQMSLGHNRVGIGLSKCDTICPRAQRSYSEVPALSDYTAPGAECYSVHAEAMALSRFAGVTEGLIMVVTCKPCPDCQTLMDDAGVVAVWRD